MKTEKDFLNIELHALVAKYGFGNVERALFHIGKTRGNIRDRAGRSRSHSDQSNKSQSESSPIKQLTARDYVSHMELDPELKIAIEVAAMSYEKKSFLPTIAEIKNFFSMYEIDVPRSLSRASAIPRVFGYLAGLTPHEVRSLLESSMFSGPARLAPIADAIRRSSAQRTHQVAAERVHESNEPLSEVLEQKNKKPSKPPVPKII